MGCLDSISRAAALLGVCADTLRRWANSHELPPETMTRTRGGHRRFNTCKVTLDANSLWPEDQPVDGQGVMLLAIYREAVVARKAADEPAGPWVFLCEGIDSGARIVNFRSGQRVHALPKNFVVAFTSGKTVEGRFATNELTGDAILRKGNTEVLRLPVGLLNYLTGLKAKARPTSSVAQPVVGTETQREIPRPIPSVGCGTTDGTGTA